MARFYGYGNSPFFKRRIDSGIPYTSDLAFRSTTRSGNTLTDEIGDNDATISINHFSSAGTPVLYYADSGALDIASGSLTIAIWLEDLSVTDAVRTIFGKSCDSTPPLVHIGFTQELQGNLLFIQNSQILH